MTQGVTSPPGLHGLARPGIGYVTYGLDRPLSGIGRYAVELARALHRSSDRQALTLLSPFRESSGALRGIFPQARIHGRLLPSFMAIGPMQIARIARQHRLSVVHDPTGVSPFLAPGWPRTVKRLVTIHDMIPFVHPETHTSLTNLLFHHYIRRSLAYVDGIITVSEASKRDILRFYQIPDDRVHVIYNGVAPEFSPRPRCEVESAMRRYRISGPYILSVGALQERKNLATLFRAYRQLLENGVRHQLVIVGKEAWRTEGTFRALRELGLEEQVVLTGFVDDADLPAIYSGADVFVFPSLYEGFGLPPLEAMACGTPVITANTSSLPEIVGDAGVLVDATDVQGFMAGIQTILDDTSRRHQLAQSGLERASVFSWERTALQHSELYRTMSGCEPSQSV